MTRKQQTLIDALGTGKWTSLKTLQTRKSVKAMELKDEAIVRAFNGLRSFKGLESKGEKGNESYRFVPVVPEPEQPVEQPKVKKHPTLHKPKAQSQEPSQEESSASQE